MDDRDADDDYHDADDHDDNNNNSSNNQTYGVNNARVNTPNDRLNILMYFFGTKEFNHPHVQLNEKGANHPEEAKNGGRRGTRRRASGILECKTKFVRSLALSLPFNPSPSDSPALVSPEGPTASRSIVFLK